MAYANTIEGREITYNPKGIQGREIEAQPTAFGAINSGFIMLERLANTAEEVRRIVPAKDGIGHMTSKMSLVALYGMNRVWNQMPLKNGQYLTRRTELAGAIVQQAYGTRTLGRTAMQLGIIYDPEPTTVERMLNDEMFLRELLHDEDTGVQRLVEAHIAALSSTQSTNL